MTFEPLMDAIINTIVFLECSDDSVVDPDAAVAVMEQIAYSIQKLGLEEQAAFHDRIRHQLRQAMPPKVRECLESLPEVLGLADI